MVFPDSFRCAVTDLWYVVEKAKIKTCTRLLMETCSSCHSRVVLSALFSTTAGSVSLGMSGLSMKKLDQLCSLHRFFFYKSPVLLK